MRNLSFLYLVALLVMLSAEGAFAREETLIEPIAKKSQDRFHFSVGVGATYTPEEYEGNDDFEFRLIPLIDIGWQPEEKWHIGDAQEHGMSLGVHEVSFGHEGLALEILQFSNTVLQGNITTGIGYQFARNENDATKLRGMGDIDGHFVGKAGLEVALQDYTPLIFAFSFEHDLEGETKGMLITADIKHSVPIAQRIRLSSHVGATWADEDYMQSYYGVSASQSVRTGYNTFDTESGIKDFHMGMNILYIMDENVRLLGGITYSRLVDDAGESPIVAVGSKNQFSLMTGAIYEF